VVGVLWECAAGPQHFHQLPDQFDVGWIVRTFAGADDDPVDEGSGGLQHLRAVLGLESAPEVPHPLRVEACEVRVKARRRGFGGPRLQLGLSRLQLF